MTRETVTICRITPLAKKTVCQVLAICDLTPVPAKGKRPGPTKLGPIYYERREVAK